MKKTRSKKQRRGWIERRGDGFMLRCWIRDEDHSSGWKKQSRYLSGCSDEKQARGELEEWVNYLDSEKDGSQRLFEDFVKTDWRRMINARLEDEEIKPSTVYSYDSMLRKHIFPKLGSKALDAITPADLTDLFHELRKDEVLSVKSRVNCYALLKTIMDLAVDLDRIDSSPLRKKLHRPRLGKSKSNKRPRKMSLTAEQLKRLLEEIPADWRTLFLCLAATGLRIGELLALRWQDIDLCGGWLEVTHNLWRGRLVSPKTEAGQRRLYLPERIQKALLLHRQNSPFVEPDDFVFSRLDASPVDPDWLRKQVLYPAMKRAEIRRGRRTHGFHIFRRSAATIIAAKTGKVKLAQKQLGHAQMSTTSDIYVHPGEEELREAAEVLEEALSCPPACPPKDPTKQWIN